LVNLCLVLYDLLVLGFDCWLQGLEKVQELLVLSLEVVDFLLLHLYHFFVSC
jgi:hypothetical protein